MACGADHTPFARQCLWNRQAPQVIHVPAGAQQPAQLPRRADGDNLALVALQEQWHEQLHLSLRDRRDLERLCYVSGIQAPDVGHAWRQHEHD